MIQSENCKKKSKDNSSEGKRKNAMSLLEFSHVIKKYETGTLALNDVSFSIEEGEFVSVIGPSGAGKSTLLRCINRLTEISSGELKFDGCNVAGLDRSALRYVRTKTGMIFQNYNLVERLSVIENVLHGRLGQKSTVAGMLGLYSEEEKEEAVSILDKLGLSEQIYKRCDELSGGQKQRVGIARSIMQHPKLLLCDEPIASLDPGSAKVIMDHLKEINEKMHITCLVNLHQVDVAMQYSRRIIGITAGKVQFDGNPDNLDENRIHQIYQTGVGSLITDRKKRAQNQVSEE